MSENALSRLVFQKPRHDFSVRTSSPEVIGRVVVALTSLVFKPDETVNMFLMLPEAHNHIKGPKNPYDSSAQDILWFLRVSNYGTAPPVQIWRRFCTGPASDISLQADRIVKELQDHGDAWKYRYVEWGTKWTQEGWSPPAFDRTQFYLRHGYSEEEKIVIGVGRA